MHPQNTQDQAPADAVERAARALFEHDQVSPESVRTWGSIHYADRAAYMEEARTALAAAMPTMMIERGRISRNAFARQDWGAMRPIAHPADDDLWRGRGFLIVSREVTEWREVTP